MKKFLFAFLSLVLLVGVSYSAPQTGETSKATIEHNFVVESIDALQVTPEAIVITRNEIGTFALKPIDKTETEFIVNDAEHYRSGDALHSNFIFNLEKPINTVSPNKINYQSYSCRVDKTRAFRPPLLC